MTTAAVKQAIRAFLRSPDYPQVLCIRGKWGIGKTYMWDETFEEAKAGKDVSLPYYCYVSLFGLQSIDEVRQTIFENRVPTSEIKVEPTLKSVEQNLKRYAELAAKQASRLASYTKLPYLDKYISSFAGGIRQIVALAVRDTIICFDDFERKKLSTKDLLGVISQFREKRNCKAVIILNEDALSDDEKADFRRYFEKVVDAPVEFAPTPEECADIAIKDRDAVSEQIRENAVKLGISNIRILNRIRALARDLTSSLAVSSEETRRQAIHTLSLCVWSKYDDEGVPISFIKEQGSRPLMFVEQNEQTEDEKKWSLKLEDYGFNVCDTLDLAILSGIEKGFFSDEVAMEAAKQDEEHSMSASKQALYEAWRKFHNSFEDNASEAVGLVYSAYAKSMKAVSRGSLDEAILMFRRLGFDLQVSELIKAYVSFNEGKIVNVDDPDDPFYSTVKDAEFRTALANVAVPPPQKPIRESLISISQGDLKQSDLNVAIKLSEQEFYDLFKSSSDSDLSGIIKGSLFWKNVSNATPEQKESAERAIRALYRIGNESPINAIRVGRFGVKIEPPAVPAS